MTTSRHLHITEFVPYEDSGGRKAATKWLGKLRGEERISMNLSLKAAREQEGGDWKRLTEDPGLYEIRDRQFETRMYFAIHDGLGIMFGGSRKRDQHRAVEQCKRRHRKWRGRTLGPRRDDHQGRGG